MVQQLLMTHSFVAKLLTMVGANGWAPSTGSRELGRKMPPSLQSFANPMGPSMWFATWNFPIHRPEPATLWTKKKCLFTYVLLNVVIVVIIIARVAVRRHSAVFFLSPASREVRGFYCCCFGNQSLSSWLSRLCLLTCGSGLHSTLKSIAGAEVTVYTLGLVQNLHEPAICWEVGQPGLSLVRDTPPWEEYLYLPNVPGDQSSLSKEDRPESFLTSPVARLGLSTVRIQDSNERCWPHLPATSETSGPRRWGLRVSSLTRPHYCPETSFSTHFLRHSPCPSCRSLSHKFPLSLSQETLVSPWAPTADPGRFAEPGGFQGLGARLPLPTAVSLLSLAVLRDKPKTVCSHSVTDAQP